MHFDADRPRPREPHPAGRDADLLVAHAGGRVRDRGGRATASSSCRSCGARSADAELQVGLESPLPPELAVGAGTALFVAGTCFAPGERIDVAGAARRRRGAAARRVRDAAAGDAAQRDGPDGYAQRVLGHRADRGRARRGAASRWGCAPGSRAAARRRRRSAAIPLRAAPSSRVAGAGAARRRSAWRPATRRSSCSARQVDSIRAQTHTDWVCVVSDDCSAPERFAAIQEVLARRPALRALARPPPARLLPQLRARAGAGARRGGLRRARRPGRPLAPGQARDAAGRARRRAPRLQRRPGGRARRPRARRQLLGPAHEQPHRACSRCWWPTRSPAPRRCSRADLLDDALPFPPAQFAHFHDHWLALVRAVARRHRASSSGRSTTTSSTVTRRSATPPPTACRRMRERFGALRRDPRERIRLWRMHYYVDACRLLQFAAVLRLRCWERMPAAKRRELERFERADRSLAPIAGLGVARRAGAARPPPRHARRRVDALPRVRLAAAAVASAPATGRRASRGWTRSRPPAFDPRPGARAPAEPAARVIAREDRAAAARGPRRRAAADQPADPVDRPPALLRGLHRQVQPRHAARRARRAGPHRHRRPGRLAARARGAATSRPTAGSTGCSARSRSSSGASRRGSR